MEIWKPVHGYEASYEVSNFGQVRRIGKGLAVRAGRILTPRLTPDGYAKVKLSRHAKSKLASVHVLVLEAFIEPRPDGMQCNHLNGIRHDNRLENLAWVTPSENLQHAYDVLGRTPPQGQNHGNAKLTEADIREIRRLHKLHQGYHSHEYSYPDLAKRFNVSPSLIGHIVRGIAWKHIHD